MFVMCPLGLEFLPFLFDVVNCACMCGYVCVCVCVCGGGCVCVSALEQQ